MIRLLWALAVPIMVLMLAGLFAWASYNGWSPAPVVAEVEQERREQATEDRLEEQEDFSELCRSDPDCRM